MVQGMSIASFNCDSFHLIGAQFFFLNKNHTLKNLTAKVEKVLTILSLSFLNLESMIHYLLIT